MCNEIIQLPDFIFLDLNMPKMYGRTCLAELRKDVRLATIPVIIFTTSSDPKDINEIRKLGASYFLTKPYNLQKLREEIAYVMAKNFLHGNKVPY